MASTVSASPPGLSHLAVPINVLPRYLKSKNDDQIEKDREIWMRWIWHAIASETYEETADMYFNNSHYNRIQPDPVHFSQFRKDLVAFYINVKKCVHQECTNAALQAASERGISTYDNDGIKMSIKELNHLSLALGKRLDTAIDKEDLPALKSVLQDAYDIQYGEHMKRDAGDAWKSKALFVELEKMMRGKLVECGGKGVQVSNPLSELFTKVYDSIRGSISRHLGLQVLKKLPNSWRKDDSHYATLNHFFVKFDFDEKKYKRGEKAWLLFHSEEEGDLSTAKKYMIQAHTLLEGIGQIAASHSLKMLMKRLDSESLNVLCFVILLIRTILTPLL